MSFNQLLVDQPRPVIAGSAVILGDAHIGAGVILAQGLVVRAHGAAVSIGNYSAILENGVVIGTPEYPVRVRIAPRAARQSRLKALFRPILAIPSYIIFGYGVASVMLYAAGTSWWKKLAR